MRINTSYLSNNIQKNETENLRENKSERNTEEKSPKSVNYRANFFPFSFKGNAPEIKNAYFITPNGDNIPVEKISDNGSYLIDKDYETEVIYGKEALKYLSKTNLFDYDTQIIFPKKAHGKLTINKKTIDIHENGGILISGGTNAKVSTDKGYPFIIVTKNKPDWYDKFANNTGKENIQNKFFEIMTNNAHSYNGEFKTDILLPDNLKDDVFLRNMGIDKYNTTDLLSELTKNKDKLEDKDKEKIDFLNNLIKKSEENLLLQRDEKGYYRFTKSYNTKYCASYLKENGYSDYEINTLLPVLELTRNLRMQTVVSRHNEETEIPTETINKMKEYGILYNNKKNTEQIFWKKSYENESALRKDLEDNHFAIEEIENIIYNWKKSLMTGFDLSGLQFINSDIAVYNLKDKVNNWTLEETNWITNSTALANTKGEAPTTGVSIVQANENKIYDIDELRKGEELHSHPDFSDKHQTELYLITSGTAIMNIVKDGKTELLKLKEGDLAVIQPGVQHCINSVKGEYEQIVVQIPSAFQYGFGFKQKVNPPEDYKKEELLLKAKNELEKE